MITPKPIPIPAILLTQEDAVTTYPSLIQMHEDHGGLVVPFSPSELRDCLARARPVLLNDSAEARAPRAAVLDFLDHVLGAPIEHSRYVTSPTSLSQCYMDPHHARPVNSSHSSHSSDRHIQSRLETLLDRLVIARQVSNALHLRLPALENNLESSQVVSCPLPSPRTDAPLSTCSPSDNSMPADPPVPKVVHSRCCDLSAEVSATMEVVKLSHGRIADLEQIVKSLAEQNAATVEALEVKFNQIAPLVDCPKTLHNHSLHLKSLTLDVFMLHLELSDRLIEEDLARRNSGDGSEDHVHEPDSGVTTADILERVGVLEKLVRDLQRSQADSKPSFRPSVLPPMSSPPVGLATVLDPQSPSKLIHSRGGRDSDWCAHFDIYFGFAPTVM